MGRPPSQNKKPAPKKTTNKKVAEKNPDTAIVVQAGEEPPIKTPPVKPTPEAALQKSTTSESSETSQTKTYLFEEELIHIKESLRKLAGNVNTAIASDLVKFYYRFVNLSIAADGTTRFLSPYKRHVKYPHRHNGSKHWTTLMEFHMMDALACLWEAYLDQDNAEKRTAQKKSMKILRNLAIRPHEHEAEGSVATGFYLKDTYLEESDGLSAKG